jgi:hypothetical protein
LKDKIKNHKIFDKIAKETNKKSKVEEPNPKISYTQIRIEGLNLKQNIYKRNKNEIRN